MENGPEMKSLNRLAAALALAGLLASAPARADVSEVRISKQPSIIYMAMLLMEHDKLIEKHGAQQGLPNLKANWLTFTGGGAGLEALISGNVDLVTTGVTNLLVAWDRTKGEVKGVSGAAATPLLLVTRNPDVKTLADFTEKDKIAVPTIKISTQAIVMQMAAEKLFGESGRNKLDPITVQLGHPDATASVLSPMVEVNSHFSAPPYQQLELKDPRVHLVLDSNDVIGGPLSNAVVFGTRKFHDANPKVVAAFLGALEEANAIIDRDPRRAAEVYLEMTREKFAVDELAALIKSPGMIYSATPHATTKVAEHMFKTGLIKTRPKSWQDFFFPEIHNRPGT